MATPAMQQYYDIKNKYNDSIVFFRMGDFYEMFGDDAHIAHKVLGINVTSRNKNAKNPEPLAGIPYHAKDKYLPQLVNAGYKVAIVEQVGDPKLKGIVKREVVRVVTPATLTLEGDIYDNFDQNIIISISKTKNIFGLSIIDISTNKWQTNEFLNFLDLQKELYKLNPKEVILDKTLYSDEELKEILQKKYSLNIYYFELKENAKEKLLNHFHLKNLNGFGIENKTESIKSSALLLSYLEINQKSSLVNFDTIGVYCSSDFLELDSATIKNLDLIYNFYTGNSQDGTLFGILNKTKTIAGKRFLRENILKPLKNKEEIEKRLIFVEEFYNNKILLDKIREKLSYISDIDAILNRLALERNSPRDLLNLKRSLKAILEIIEIINKEGSNKIKKILE